MEERLLLKKAKQGDLVAFEALVRIYQNKIYALALRMTENREDAFDVAQEAVLKLYRGLSAFREKSSFATWVYSVTRNAALDFLRKKKSSVSLEELREQGVEPCGQEDDPESQVLKDEKICAVTAAINALPEQQKTVLILRDIEGYSYEEIAIIIGTTRGTVKSRLFRAREQVRKKYSELGENNE